jgi:hypothetical protein|nr:hypothetical protein [Kofleriaceae bacterium]
MHKPDHLEPAPLPARVWLSRHAGAVAALALGALAFVMATVARETAWAATDLRVALPGLGATAIAATISVVRREHAVWLVLSGLALAVAGLVVGYLLVLALVVAVAAVLILILHAVM